MPARLERAIDIPVWAALDQHCEDLNQRTVAGTRDDMAGLTAATANRLRRLYDIEAADGAVERR